MVAAIGACAPAGHQSGMSSAMAGEAEMRQAAMPMAGVPDVMVGGQPMLPSRTIVDNAVNSADHTTLVAAVKAAGLVDTLEGPGPFTVFAPVDSAFAALRPGTVETLLKPENRAKLTSILTYHVVPGRLDSAALRERVAKGGGTASLKTVGRDAHGQGQRPREPRARGRAGRYRHDLDLRRLPVERRHPRHRRRAAAELSQEAVAPRPTRAATRGRSPPLGWRIAGHSDMADGLVAVGRAALAADRRRRNLHPGMLNQDQAEPPALIDLLDGAAAREHRAFAELYAASSAKLFGVILRILRDREQASEVLQDVYLRIWQHAGDYRPDKGAPMTWMIAIARNRALDRRRHWRPELPLDEIEALGNLGADLEGLLEDGDRSRALRDCLGELETRQRQIVLLAYAEGYTHAELADRLACPLGTAKSLIRRGLLRLKECLER